MSRVYKSPSRRRLKKWRSRVHRLAYSHAGRRGFGRWFGELLNLMPMIDAAKRSGVDLLSDLPKPEKPLSWTDVREMLWGMMYGRNSRLSDWPTRENLEI